MMARGDTAVLVLAAGPGTRMRSDTPKVLHRIAGRSMLSHSLHAITKLAPQHLVVVLGHDHQRIAPIVADLADALGRTIDVALQDRPLGTGHAVLCGLSALPDDYAGIVVVTSGDTPLLDADTLADLIATHSTVSAAVTVLTTTLGDPVRLRPHPAHPGRRSDGDRRAQPTRRPRSAQIREVNAGVYAFDIAALRSALSRLSSNNAQQELYLTDVVAILRQDGQAVHARHVDDSALVAGVNNRVQLAELGAELNRRIVAAHQMAGVTVVDPATTWIDVDVTIGRDTVIHPGTQLLGRTQIGGHCAIGPDTTLTDVTVGDGASVVRTHGTSSAIGDGADGRPLHLPAAGHRAGLRRQARRVRRGEELHHRHRHQGAAPDLRRGRRHRRAQQYRRVQRVRQLRRMTKRRTTVGSHVRTGSDTMFVAPVTVGDGAYTGAGTVLRDDVPPGALAVSAGPQRNIEDWVQRKRPGTPAAEAAEKAAQPRQRRHSRPA